MGSHRLRGPPSKGHMTGPSGENSQWWSQEGWNCCQNWALEISRDTHSLDGGNPIRGPINRMSHSLCGPPIRGPRVGPRAGPSGGTSQWWPQDWRNCCQDWTLGVSRGHHSFRGPLIIIRGPRVEPSGGTSQWWAHDGRNCCQDWTMGVDRGSHRL